MSKQEETATLEYVQGCEGNSVYLNGRRIAGPKPWGGGSILARFEVRKADILSDLEKTHGGVEVYGAEKSYDSLLHGQVGGKPDRRSMQSGLVNDRGTKSGEAAFQF